MKSERLTEIINDATGRGSKLASVDAGFREDAAHDPATEAQTEYAEYVATVHGKRAPKTELQRIEREITHEHEQRHRAALERGLGLLDYAHGEELPTLEAYAHECEQPPTSMEEYERAVSGAGSPDRPLQLALLDEITRNNARRELGPMPPSAALALYRSTVQDTAVSPDAVVRRAVLIQEIERRSTWNFDVKAENAAAEHAAAHELQRLITETRAGRVPKELREVLDAARDARRFADRQRAARKLQPATAAELFNDAGVDQRYTGHPAIARALRKDQGR